MTVLRVHTVYQTTCLASGRFYFGCHTTDDPYDDYLGSGAHIKASIEEHGSAAHKKRVHGFHTTRREAVEHEKKLIRRHHADPLCMNSLLGLGDFGAGETSAARGQVWTEERRKALSEAHRGEGNPFWGRKHTDEARKRIKDAVSGENGPFWGKKHSTEAKQRMSAVHKGKTIAGWHKQRISEANKGRPLSQAACLHCRKVVAVTILARFHGDKCKWKAA